jgi:DNA-binding phage protein
MSRIISPGQNKKMTKHDVNRAFNNQRDAIEYLNARIQTIDGLFSEYIDFMKHRVKFKKYLDEKAKANGESEQSTSK